VKPSLLKDELTPIYPGCLRYKTNFKQPLNVSLIFMKQSYHTFAVNLKYVNKYDCKKVLAAQGNVY